MTPFEEFALNHTKHGHCFKCKGCILNPEVQIWAVMWCVHCCRTADGLSAQLIARWSNWRIPGTEQKRKGDFMDGSEKMEGREKWWSEITPDEKIERMRTQVKRLLNTLDRLERKMDQIQRHNPDDVYF